MFYKILTMITFFYFIVGCGSNETNTTYSTEDINDSNTVVQEYSFRQDIMPILVKKCQACHGNSGNYSVTTPEETYKLLIDDEPRVSTGYTHFIISNDIEHSLLYKKALNIELHGGGAQLPYDSTEARIVKEWILQGAILDDVNTTWDYTLLAWNDLGMHCMDGKDFSVFSILPPYNNLNAQLITKSGIINKHITSGVTLSYTAIKSLDGKSNTTSLYDSSNNQKTNFWEYVPQLFLKTLVADKGLTGNDTPSLTPKPLHFNAQKNIWEATALPLTPYNDDGSKNYYPMVQVDAKDNSGKLLASTKIVLPVSDEMDCKVCHGSKSNYLAAKPSAGWENDAESEKDFKYNILRLHDEKFPNAVVDNQIALKNLGYVTYNDAGLYASAKNNTPILCATCHASNAIQGVGIAGIKPLTQALHGLHANVVDPLTSMKLSDTANRESCYRCHPGATTQCLRGAMGKAVDLNGLAKIECQSCHGNMSAIAKHDREGWLDEPNCQSCHQDAKRYTTAVIDSTTGTLRVSLDDRFATQGLYKTSVGHGKMQCSACHGSTHSIYPSSHAEDNIQSKILQGYIGTVSECSACHVTTPETTSGGAHGMHTIGASWIRNHQKVALIDTTQCQSCHGIDYKGTILSKTATTREFIKHYDAKELVSCYDCHNGPSGH